MGIFQIVENYSSGNNRQQVAMVTGLVVPKNVTISSTHAESSALDNATIGFRANTDTACWWKPYKSGAASPLGDVATASNGIKMDANTTEYFGINMVAGISISIITA